MIQFLPTYPDFVRSRTKDPKEIVSELTPLNADLLHMALGLVGELTETMKAIYLPKDPDPAAEQNAKDLAEELGDSMFYIQGLINILQQSGVEFDYTIKQDQLGREELATIANESPLNALIIVAGDLLSFVKKSALYGRELDMNKLAEMITQVYRQAWFGFFIEPVEEHQVPEYFQPINLLKDNVAKLEARYPTGYSNADALIRADKQV